MPELSFSFFEKCVVFSNTAAHELRQKNAIKIMEHMDMSKGCEPSVVA